jgi:hypothetical protein
MRTAVKKIQSLITNRAPEERSHGG